MWKKHVIFKDNHCSGWMFYDTSYASVLKRSISVTGKIVIKRKFVAGVCMWPKHSFIILFHSVWRKNRNKIVF
jgi:hypothetical protein